MASKNFTQLRADGAYELRLEMSSVPNTSGNYSDVTYNLYVRSISSTAAYNYGYGNRVYLAINNSVILDTANIGRVTFTGPNQTHQFAHGTVRVNHNEDGSKGIAVRAIFQQTQALSAANYDISGTFALDTIPRTSVPTLSVENAILGETSVKLTTNRASSSFTHTLTMKIGSKTVKTVEDVGASYTWTPAESLASNFKTSKSATLAITCVTYNGSTKIGSEVVNLTLKIPDDMIPTCSVSVEEAATLPSGITGFIKGKSRLKITVSASGVQGSTIDSYTIKANGATYNETPKTTEVLTTKGTNTITAVVTDSRKMKSETASKSITVIDYSAPSISKLSAYRCTSDTDATELDTGEYIAVTLTGKVTALSNQNGKSCIVYYQKNGESDWTACPEMMAGYTLTDATVIFPADTDSSYNVKVEIKDSFSTSTYYQTVGSGFTLINIPASGKGLGIGKVAEKDELVDSAWDIHTEGQLNADGYINAGSEDLESDMCVYAINKWHKMALHVSAAGNAGLWDKTFGKWLAYMTTSGVGYFNGGLRTQSITVTEEDLNNYTIPGVYYFSSSYPPTNIPAGSNGILIVHGGSILKQIWLRQGTKNSNDHQTWVRTYFGSSSGWSDWHRFQMSEDAPVYGGNAANGYVRFPTIKLQICWQIRTFTSIKVTNAWGTMYESGVLSFLDFAASFAAVPTCVKMLTGDNYGCFLQPYSAVTATNPGTAYACRPNSNSTGTTLYGMVIAIGKYS